MGILGLERIVDNKRCDSTKRESGCDAVLVNTDRNKGVCTFKLLKQVFAFRSTGGKDAPCVE